MRNDSFIVGLTIGAAVASLVWIGVLAWNGWNLALDEFDPGADRQERALQIRAYDNCFDDPTCPLGPRSHLHWEKLRQIQDGEPDD